MVTGIGLSSIVLSTVVCHQETRLNCMAATCNHRILPSSTILVVCANDCTRDYINRQVVLTMHRVVIRVNDESCKNKATNLNCESVTL